MDDNSEQACPGAGLLGSPRAVAFPKAFKRSVFEIPQGESADGQVWGDTLPPSAAVSVVVAKPVGLLWKYALPRLRVAPRAAFVGEVRAFELPREQIHDQAVELPGSAFLFALCGFGGVAMDINAERRSLGVVRNERRQAMSWRRLWTRRTFLDCGPELACREAGSKQARSRLEAGPKRAQTGCLDGRSDGQLA